MIYVTHTKAYVYVKPIRKATYNFRYKWLNVEAAGIEPASRDISMTASTCVVG